MHAPANAPNAMPLANLPNDSRFAVPRRDGVEEASRLCHLSIGTPTFSLPFPHFYFTYTVSIRNPNYSDSLVHRVPIIRCRKSIEIKSKIRSGTIGDDSIAFVRGGRGGSPVLVHGHAARWPRAPVALTGFRHPHAVSPHQTHK